MKSETIICMHYVSHYIFYLNITFAKYSRLDIIILRDLPLRIS